MPEDKPRIRTGFHIGKDLFYPDTNDIKPLGTDNGSVIRSSKYNSLRGMFLPKKRSENGFDDSRKFIFQFNPEEIKIQKETVYNTRSYTGLDYTDYIWANGGEKTIQFSLFLDASPGAFNTTFRNSSTTGLDNLNDASNKKPRGVLDDCELLESFLRPDVPVKGAIKTPRFSSGGVVPSNQFYPPPVLIFVYGNFYMEGILKSADFSYTNFKPNLIPMRAETNVVFAVLEQQEVSINTVLNQIRPQIASAFLQSQNKLIF